MNSINIVGRLTKDPELKTGSNGTEYCKFTVAVDRDYKDKDGNKASDFFDVSTFKGTAAFVSKYFHKGDGICVSGSMQSDKYTDKDGNKRTAWSVFPSNIGFVPGKKSSGSDSQEFAPVSEADEEGLPF